MILYTGWKSSKKNRNEKNDSVNKQISATTTPGNIQHFLNKPSSSFTEKDLKEFESASRDYNRYVFENIQKINEKLFLIANRLSSGETNLKSQNLQKPHLDILSQLPETFQELQTLLKEVIEDGTKESITFLEVLLSELTLVEKKLKRQEPLADSIYGQLSEMLVKLQTYNISQQKYIYRTIANCINKVYPNHELISSEDGNFVDPKFHRIISGDGQRIARGLSYILLDKNTKEVLKFGNIKTI